MAAQAALDANQCNVPASLLAMIFDKIPAWCRVAARLVCKGIAKAFQADTSISITEPTLPLHVVQQLQLPSTPEKRRRLLKARITVGDAQGVRWLLGHVPGLAVDGPLWHIAAAAGHVGVLEALQDAYETVAEAAAVLKTFGPLLFVIAAQHGHLATMQWLQAQQPAECLWDEQTPLAAADAGHWSILQWLVERGHRCSFSHQAIETAVRQGQVQLVEAMNAMQPGCLHHLMVYAVEGGHLDLAQMIYAHPGGLGCTMHYYKVIAISNSHTHIVMWLNQLQERKLQQTAAAHAAGSGAAQPASFRLSLPGNPLRDISFPSIEAIKQLVQQKGWKGHPSAAECLVKQWVADGVIIIIDDISEYLPSSNRYRRVLTVVLAEEGSGSTVESPAVLAAVPSDVQPVDLFLDQQREGTAVMRFGQGAKPGPTGFGEETEEYRAAAQKLFTQVAAVVCWRLQHELERLQLYWLAEADTVGSRRDALRRSEKPPPSTTLKACSQLVRSSKGQKAQSLGLQSRPPQSRGLLGSRVRPRDPASGSGLLPLLPLRTVIMARMVLHCSLLCLPQVSGI